MSVPFTRASRLARLEEDLGRRIVVLDGPKGTEIQALRLSEAQFRGTRFADWPRDLRGCNDLLALTRPDALRAIHRAYLDAGAEICGTNTFNSTRISLADYGLEALAGELNEASARLVRSLGDAPGGRGGARGGDRDAAGPPPGALAVRRPRGA